MISGKPVVRQSSATNSADTMRKRRSAFVFFMSAPPYSARPPKRTLISVTISTMSSSTTDMAAA